MSLLFSHPNAIYSLEIPDGWEHEMRGSSVILSKPNGSGGAIVVSCVAPPSGESPDPKAFIEDFVAKKLPPEEDQAISIAALPIRDNRMQLRYTSYRARGDSWRVWAISDQNRLLFATYNCHPSFDGKEDAEVDYIIGSARFS